MKETTRPGKCFNCGRSIEMKKDIKGHDYYHCLSCQETRFFYAGIQPCNDYVPLTIAKNGSYTAFCSRHGIRVFRQPRFDLWGKKIEEGKTVRL